MGMGKMEEKSTIRLKKDNLQRAILGSVAAVGLLSVAMMAPNAVKMFNLFGGTASLSFDHKQRMKRSLNSLIRKELLEFITEDGKKYLRLTPRGEKKLAILSLNNFQIKKPKKWDGKYRVIIFDIKETRRTDRERWRVFLRQIGFMRLQHSVWVFPYDCEDVILMLKTHLHIGKDILYMIVDDIEYDKKIREYFDLPKE